MINLKCGQVGLYYTYNVLGGCIMSHCTLKGWKTVILAYYPHHTHWHTHSLHSNVGNPYITMMIYLFPCSRFQFRHVNFLVFRFNPYIKLMIYLFPCYRFQFWHMSFSSVSVLLINQAYAHVSFSLRKMKVRLGLLNYLSWSYAWYELYTLCKFRPWSRISMQILSTVCLSTGAQAPICRPKKITEEPCLSVKGRSRCPLGAPLRSAP